MNKIPLELLLGTNYCPPDAYYVCGLILATVIFAWRAFRHQATLVDLVAFGVFLLSSGLVFFLHYLEGKSLHTYWRYHYPAFAVLLPFLAMALNKICCHQWYLVVVVAVAIAIVPFNSCREMVKRSYKPAKNWQAADAAAVKWAAERIREHYTGPARHPMAYCVHEYLSERQPTVFTRYQRLAVEIHGRLVFSDLLLREWEDPPQYAFLLGRRDDVWFRQLWPEVELEPLGCREIGGRQFRLYHCRATSREEL